MIKSLILFLILFPSLAQGLEATASVDKNKVALNESFVFTIRIQSQGEKSSSMDIPDLSQLKDFHLLGQWSGQESSIHIINGQMEKSSVFSQNYRLQPKREGPLKIKALTIKAEGQMLTTDPILIFVTPAGQGPANPPSQNFSNPFPSPPSLFDIFDDPFGSKNAPQDNIKLYLNLSKNFAYKGEMIKADWIILKSSKVNYDLEKTPTLQGFWKEEKTNKPPGSPLGTQVINNVLYMKTLLISNWLFPLKAGDLVVDSYAIQIRSFFNFGFSSQPKTKSSPIKKIRVKELPPRLSDHKWTGAVGSFKVHAEVKEEFALMGKPFSYKIIFKGLGHPRFITLPDLKFPPSAQIYPPVEKSHFYGSGRGIKEFEILIVPKERGVLTIPSFELSSFDPKIGRYVFHKTPSFSLFVKGGKNQKSEGQNFFKEEEKKQEKGFSLEPLSFSYWPRFITHKNLVRLWMVLLGLGWLIWLYLYLKNFAFKKEKSLKEQIHQKFKLTQELLDQGDGKKACAHILQTAEEALSLVQIKDPSASWRQALQQLPPSLSQKYSARFTALFKELESLSFAPSSGKGRQSIDQTKKMFQEAKNLISSFLSDL